MRAIPRLYELTPGQILELMRDLHYFFMHDYRVIVAADSHELIDYCFPVDPNDDTKEINAERIAESQAALNHMFTDKSKDRPPVILLPEYAREIKELMTAVYERSREVYPAAELIQAMIVAGDLQTAATQERAELESVVEKGFQYLLTILLGLQSYGVERMNEVYTTGLTPLEDTIAPEDRAYFEQILDNYKPSHLYDTIFKALEGYSNKGRGRRRGHGGKQQRQDGRSDEERRERDRLANEADAKVIDRLIYLNSEADSASRNHLLAHKYLFLYLSDADKSRRVFEEPAVRAALPRIRKRRYPILRNRQQILAYVVYRGHGNSAKKRAQETFEALKTLHSLLLKLEGFEKAINSESNDCRHCVLDNKVPAACSLEGYCREVLETSNRIKKKQDEVTNWGLFNKINSYAKLADSGVPEMGYDIYMQLFRDLLESDLRDIALERMYEKQLYIARASDWIILKQHIQEEIALAESPDMRSRKDQVRGIYQYLPGKPRFKSARYKEIVVPILGFFRQPDRKDLLQEVYHKFSALEHEPGLEDDEYDLLKCYLYLTFGFEGEKVHSYIKNTLLHEKRMKDDAETWRESLYILCWSARRFGFHEEADKYSQEGIRRYPDDPRFLHGLALNIYSWQVKDENCPYRIADAISASESALELYRQPELDSDDQVAVSHNNLAYLLAYDVQTTRDPEERTRKLLLAREHLQALKRAVDKSEWNPTHPEFFHTESFLEYHEVIHFWMSGERDHETLKAKLRSAKQDIETAIDIYDSEMYRDLRDEIEEFHRGIISGGIR